MIKLFAVDMDKTCLNDKNQMSDETLQALQNIAKQGIIVVPTTGRSLECLPHRLKKQDFYRYVISSNGAKVTDIQENKTLFRSEIKKEEALAFIHECSEKKLGRTAHIHHQYLIEGKLLYKFGQLIYGEDAHQAIQITNLEQTIASSSFDVEEIQLYFFSQKTKKKIQEILAQHHHCSAAFTKHYVEIYSTNTSKGIALKELMNHLNIKEEEVACIGDGENDLSMFDVAGYKFAIGNAVDALKEKADVILPSNNENGVCNCCDYLKEYKGEI